jgi:hypothetical protein
MNFGLTLNVAISLTFVYVLASLLASTVNEMIAGVLKLRGVYLTKAIESLTSLGTNNQFAWGGIPGWFRAYFGQTTAEVSKCVDQATTAAVNAAKTAPVYRVLCAVINASAKIWGAIRNILAPGAAPAAQTVTAHTNLRALIDTAAGAPGATARSVSNALRPAMGIATLQQHPLLVGTPSSLPSYVPSRDFASALLSYLTDGSVDTGFTQARNAINNLPDGDLKKTLLAFISSGANDLDKLRTRIENWFDDSMERLGGIYRRFSQYVMLLLGLITAVVMNVNSIQLARMFWDEPAVSGAISAGAAKFVADNKDSFFACASAAPEDAASTDANKAAAPAAANCPTRSSLTTVQKLIADRFGCVKPFPPVIDKISPNACQLWAPKAWTILGWIVTALAISLGAQFWFGILTNLTSLRAAGDKPDRADKKS